MPELEILSARYQDVVAVTHTSHRSGGPCRRDIVLPDSETVDRFHDNPFLSTLEIEEPSIDMPAVHLFFMKEAIVTVRHARELLQYRDIALGGGEQQEITGRRFVLPPDFVAVEVTQEGTRFAPLTELRADGEPLSDHTSSIVSLLTNNGHYSDSVTRALLPRLRAAGNEPMNRFSR